ncbi:IpaC/SipC family type III secretion system effector BipC [Burkholderia pseudomallei]|uniref:IpaC/SipC family type III secretion system effector BipC n=1 Tax=Burkholderia pseudomallei TaxID=28450 RepID=UPI00035B9DE7|nr:IpaC/SipC family type III secretion system effector BipC [Burkholderia pseudomallei]AGR68169.1 type III secretion target, IpaC/SipC family protein [Burkholderia pseudomallei MSHR305]AHK68007.1 type III secretion target, IpaC/SipC family protein [Burkholderia pseudomallei MSHR520]AIP81643.1 type III secretion target, IpaC/SipC family protein [Burkholderia pseudomallei]APZ21181.1 restriction endonuclease [Burkholderia pseudomallei]APZ27381.1 restriction endonuclease [Burkholderia pseudomallei
MSIGVQSSGINISHAELSRLVDAGKSEQGDKAVRDDGRALARADATLAAVVGERVAARRDAVAGSGAQRVELARPKPDAQTRATDRRTVSGLEREHKRLAASQTPRVTGMHDALVQRHVSLDGAKAAHGEGVKRAAGDAPRAAADAPQRFAFADDKAFDAMLALGAAMQKNVQSDLAMQGKLTMLAHDAMMSAAAQDRSIGAAQMTAAIAGGALQATTSLGGAMQQMKSLSTKSMSIEKELKPQAELKQFHAEQALELRGINKPVLSNDEVSHVKIKRDTGETVRHEIDHGGERMSDEHASVLAQEAPARQHRIDMHGMRHEENLVKAGRQQMKGDLLQSGGQIGKNQIDGASAQQQGADRAEQKEDENAQQTAMAAASTRDEAAHRSREAAQKAIDAAKSQVANDNAVAAQVAGNLRT